MVKFYLLRIFKNFKFKILLAVFTVSVMLFVPFYSFFYIDTYGVPDVAKVLAAVNPDTNRVEVREIDGTLITTAAPSTAWPNCGYVSAGFGVPHWPFQPTHTGIDIASPGGRIGDPVSPFMAGTITEVQKQDFGGFGKYVVVRHGRKFTSLYGHLSGVTVKKGQKVKPNSIIGLVGNTGLSTGPHVHFEVRIDGTPVDPRVFMAGSPKMCT